MLVVHGFTGNPSSMLPLAERLAGAGLTIDLPLLPGHGTALLDLLDKRFTDWSAAAEAAYEALAARSERVFVAGLSMGGTLACWLAERHPGIAGIIVVNPLVDSPAPSFRELLAELERSGAGSVPGVGSDIAKEGVVELAYEETPVAAVLSLFEGVDAVAEGLGSIRCPVLLFSSRHDHVVPSSSGDLLEEKVSGRVERIWLEHSYHVATLDNDADEVANRSVAFVQDVCGASEL